MAYRILSACQYKGTFTNQKGENIPYEKVFMVVSNNGRYPQMLSVNKDVFVDANGKAGGKILDRDVEMLGAEEYGKFKIKKIELL